MNNEKDNLNENVKYVDYVELKFEKTQNYNLDQSKEIALKAVNGTVIKTNENLDNGIVEYKISIKDNDNFLKKVTVNGENGVITKIKDNMKNKNDFYNFENHKHNY